MPERALYAEASDEDEGTDVLAEVRLTYWKNGEVSVTQEGAGIGGTATFRSLNEATAYIQGLCTPRPE